MYKQLIIDTIKQHYNPDLEKLDACISSVLTMLDDEKGLPSTPGSIAELANVIDPDKQSSLYLMLTASHHLKVGVSILTEQVVNEMTSPESGSEIKALAEEVQKLGMLTMYSLKTLIGVITHVYNSSGVNLYDVWDIDKLSAQDVIRLTICLDSQGMEVLGHWFVITGREDIFNCGTLGGLINFIEPAPVSQFARLQYAHSPYVQPPFYHVKPRAQHGPHVPFVFPLEYIRPHHTGTDGKGNRIMLAVHDAVVNIIPSGITINVIMTHPQSNITYKAKVITVNRSNQWHAVLSPSNEPMPRGEYLVTLRVNNPTNVTTTVLTVF